MMEIINANAVEWARNYSGELYHALLCDPPYHMTSGNLVYDLALTGSGNPRVRRKNSAGFMGKKWDGGDVAFQPETWAAFSNVLHPGAFGMAFASARGWHRLACAIEDAGLIIHPSIFGWAYGSGFPKATRIDTQIDKANGRKFDDRYELGRHIRECRVKKGISRAEVNARFESVAICNHWEAQDENNASVPTFEHWQIIKDWFGCDPRFDSLIDRYGAEREVVGRHDSGLQTGFAGVGGGGNGELITAPATPLAASWAGHRYGLQALKPALEPIIVFQKPYQGKPVECITRTGAGAINIDAGRIGTEQREYHYSSTADGGVPHKGVNGAIDGRDPEKIAARISRNAELDPVSVSGRWPANFILTCAPDCPAARLDEMSGESKSSGGQSSLGAFRNGYIYGKGKDERWNADPGLGDTGGASRFFFRVQEQIDESDPVYYCAKASRRERDAGLDEPARCNHPTVKPIALARYLATLLLPPADYAPRRLFVPFSGVASEMIGAQQAGWEEVTGVESDTEYGYVDISEARIMHYCGMFVQ